MGHDCGVRHLQGVQYECREGLLVYLLLLMHMKHRHMEQLKLVDKIRSCPKQVGSEIRQVQGTLLLYEATVQKYLGTALPF